MRTKWRCFTTLQNKTHSHTIVTKVTNTELQIQCCSYGNHTPINLKTIKTLTNQLFIVVHSLMSLNKIANILLEDNPCHQYGYWTVRVAHSHMEQAGIKRTILSHQVRQIITDSNHGYNSLDIRLPLQFPELRCANNPFCHDNNLFQFHNCLRLVVSYHGHKFTKTWKVSSFPATICYYF